GTVFFQSGWAKLHDLEQVTDYFTTLGLPHPAFQARLASSAEFVWGGLLRSVLRWACAGRAGDGLRGRAVDRHHVRGNPRRALGERHRAREPGGTPRVLLHRAAHLARDRWTRT